MRLDVRCFGNLVEAFSRAPQQFQDLIIIGKCLELKADRLIVNCVDTTWQVCKTVYAGSIPAVASTRQ